MYFYHNITKRKRDKSIIRIRKQEFVIQTLRFRIMGCDLGNRRDFNPKPTISVP